MGEVSARLGLPFLATGQAQKEVWHNEALALVDLALHAAVEAVGANAPPSAPAEGRAWIVGVAPTGAWTGHANALAGWTGGGWRFVPAVEGLAVWLRGAGGLARFADGAWTVAARQPAIGSPTGGTVVDAESRATITSILATLRAHRLIAA